jgi:hypothetical protein
MLGASCMVAFAGDPALAHALENHTHAQIMCPDEDCQAEIVVDTRTQSATYDGKLLVTSPVKSISVHPLLADIVLLCQQAGRTETAEQILKFDFQIGCGNCRRTFGLLAALTAG